MCMCVFRPHELQCPQRPECARFPGATACERCEPNPGPLEKQQVLKPTELSLQHLFLYFCTHTRVCVREKGRFPPLSLSIYSFDIASPMKPKVYFLLAVLEISMPRRFSWPHLPLSWVCRGVSQGCYAGAEI